MAFVMIFLSLGSWQLNRAHQKEKLQNAFDDASKDRPVVLAGTSVAPEGLGVVRGHARGQFDSARQLLLDNQPRDGVPGYRVWTPLRLDSGGLLIVDRGWLPADPRRDHLPKLDLDGSARMVSGYWRSLPEPAIRLNANPCVEDRFPRVVSYPTFAQLKCIFRLDAGETIADGILLLNADQADGFVREWTLPNPVPPSRHYAYAAQWFAFAATLLGIFFWLGFKRRR